MLLKSHPAFLGTCFVTALLVVAAAAWASTQTPVPAPVTVIAGHEGRPITFEPDVTQLNATPESDPAEE